MYYVFTAGLIMNSDLEFEALFNLTYYNEDYLIAEPRHMFLSQTIMKKIQLVEDEVWQMKFLRRQVEYSQGNSTPGR